MLRPDDTVHFIGIGGIGMSAVARYLLERGIRVTGSDVRESSLTRALRAEGAKVVIGHDPRNVRRATLVVHSSAVPADNPERLEAGRLGLRRAHRAELLAALLEEGRESVGVTGTHGKGTTAGLVVWIAHKAGLDPGFLIGAILLDFGRNARVGGGRLTVAEVDESDGSHLQVRPHHVVCNNLELDHLNYYTGLEDILETQRRFIEENPLLRSVALNLGDAGVRALAARLRVPVVGYAADGTDADYVATNLRVEDLSTEFDVLCRGERLGRVRLSLPGEYNVDNALAAVTVAHHAIGIPFDAITEGLATFSGLENRFTVVRAGGVTLVKDYLSHPTGMRKVLRAARRLGPGRLWAVFRPYRFTLLRYLGDEYARAFEAADRVLLTDMFTAGEEPIPGIDETYLDRKVEERGIPVAHVPTSEEIPSHLGPRLRAGDVVVLFGGDDFFQMADAFAADLARRPLSAEAPP